MYLLDTNVLSEVVRPAPDARVTAALANLHASDLFASMVSRYELRYGARLRQDANHFWGAPATGTAAGGGKLAPGERGNCRGRRGASICDAKTDGLAIWTHSSRQQPWSIV